ncbi:hypothetical protein CYPRO_2751 [Cyclonatronum proteinivorum]|uniref:Uncharacterized protein n=1 Tax=Cyclonatronum proteinivorum TaxID=1457365 RepID=A0A345UND8_9BACT|nr:hypothetical protein [Cyclonatronum proteinivorum]AXJ01990.1 hypothetical protein CYPRO_2751 [Cyclonatronum proteinivorum]
MSFERNIFINCPFDDDYYPLLKPLLFTIISSGFQPRITLERSDSGEVRLNKIKELIEASKFSIHDLSRAKSKRINEYFRQNMPFELGLDLGCRDYHPDKKYRSKKFLILEEEKYSTQKALSDLSFADCKCHNGDAEEIVYEVRNWLAENGIKMKSASSVWDAYNKFYADLFEQKSKEGFKLKDINRLPIAEFMRAISEQFK